MFVFWILAILVLVSALAVVVLPNPLHSALCLAMNLVAVAGIYALLGAHFLAAVQIIVYAGAIMVLVVFVLMLLNVKSEKRTLLDLGLLLIAVCTAGSAAYLFLPLLHQEFAGKIMLTSTADASLAGGVVEIGKKLFGEQAFLFQLTAIVLITAIVGAVMLASQRKVILKVSPADSQANNNTGGR